MKRFWITLTALVSIKTFAALPVPTYSALPFPDAMSSGLITIPQFHGGLVLGVSGFYLQPTPSNGDLDYVQINANVSSPRFGKQMRRVNPGYDVGWGANVGYIFPNTGNDANVNYFHLGTTDAEFIRGAGFVLVNPGAQLDGPTAVHAQAEYTISQVDVTAGQFINLGRRLILHPNIDVRWVQICRQIFSLVNNNTGETISVISVQDYSNYHGLGPLLGLDANYRIVYGLNFVGHFDAGVLFGYINAHTSSNDFVNDITVTNQFSEEDLTRIVPVTDAKLGINYVFVMDIPTDSNLTLEAGWQFSKFFNAVDRIYGSQIGEAGTVNENKLSNVGLNGPYIKIVFRA